MKNIFDIDFIKEIWQSISRNKVRSILTGFGVAWGILMFIIMAGIGNGFKNGLLYGLGDFPKNSFYIFSSETSIEYKGFNEGRKWDLTNDDVKMLKDNIPEIRYICGIVFGNYQSSFVYEDKTGNYSIKGVDEMYHFMEPSTIIYGRQINPIDVKEKRKVCTIGQKIYEQLFDYKEDPIGKLISINNSYYTVVGVLHGSDNINVGGNLNSSAFIPVTTLQQSYNYGNTIHMLAVNVSDETNVKAVSDQVKAMIKNKHTISPDDEEAVDGFDLSSIFKMFDSLLTGIGLLIWVVGMGTLFAGVIGISNIMLVSIKERTNEIGIRRALGAKPNSIIIQIVCESTLLTAISGFIGMFLGTTILLIVTKITSAAPKSSNTMFTDPQITFSLAITALIILIVSGLLAGIIPAKKALDIKAIDALRDE